MTERAKREKALPPPSCSLLPCPFCGRAARWLRCYDEYQKETGWDIGCEGNDIGLNGCIALDGFTSFTSTLTRDEAARDWNRRIASANNTIRGMCPKGKDHE
jgi:hypothetical protein